MVGFPYPTMSNLSLHITTMKPLSNYLFISILILSCFMPLHLSAQENGFAPDGVVLHKKVVEDTLTPNHYTIELEAFVTGSTTTITSQVIEPMDIILVLDLSKSMHTNQLVAPVMEASKAFVDVIMENMPSPGKASHRLAVVGFGDGYMPHASNGVIVPLTDMDSPASATEVNSRIDALTYDKSKNHSYGEYGLERAADIFEANPATDGRQRIIVFFTDGLKKENGSGDLSPLSTISTVNMAYVLKQPVPTTADSHLLNVTVGFTYDTVGNGYARDEIYSSTRTFTHGYGADIYTVAVLKGMSEEDAETRRFLNYTSSIYPDKLLPEGYTLPTTITGEPDGQERPYDENDASTSLYHQFSRDTSVEALKKMFVAIAEESTLGGATFPLTSTSTTVVDIVSPAFQLPQPVDGSTVQQLVELMAVPCTGVVTTDQGPAYTFGAPVPARELFADIQATVEGKTVTVQGFPFSENYVGEDILADGSRLPRGYKLSIRFPIIIDPSNPGGASVNTNTTASGIYVDTGDGERPQQIGAFAVPHVKIPNLVIVKKGLHMGESALFNVYRLMPDGARSKPLVLVATCRSEGEDAIVRAKIQRPGRYLIEEATHWSWAYSLSDITTAYDYDDSTAITPSQWNAAGYGDISQGYQAPIPFAFGTKATATALIRNVNDFTEDPSVHGTLFIFTNSARRQMPAHAESARANDFYESR